MDSRYTPTVFHTVRRYDSSYSIRAKSDGRPAPGQCPDYSRFRNPGEGQVTVEDLVRGKVVFEISELDDPTIAGSDGTPTSGPSTRSCAQRIRRRIDGG